MDFGQLKAEGNRLSATADEKLAELVAAIKKADAAGADPSAHRELQELAAELNAINAKLKRVIAQSQEAIGVSEDEMVAIEQAQLPPSDDRWWLHQVLATPPSEYLDTLCQKAMDALLERVDHEWLKQEAALPYRLNDGFITSPLHLVAGTRLPTKEEPPPPQRFAHMLLVALDHLAKRDDLDFFAAASFVPELTALGRRLNFIPRLGPEAVRKFEHLQVATAEEVASTIYELLVGTACVTRELETEMLPASKAGKSPDFRLHNLGVPAVVECKRRLGLTHYELAEAGTVQRLYGRLREIAKTGGFHGALEVRFRAPIETVETDNFLSVAAPLLNHWEDIEGICADWGEVSFRRLPLVGKLAETRLYSPDFLERVFTWSPVGNEWDGLLCEVEPPERIRVRAFRNPFCLKWRSDCQDAITKRTRGITSLWAKAAKQIPPGEVGFIYIAYPEGQRSELADARTRHIRETSASLYHRWSIHIPVTIIGRLLARSLGSGEPDLIESVLRAASPDGEHWLTKLPAHVIT
jgi:hypothetical protein